MKINPNLSLNPNEEYLVTADEMRRFDTYTSDVLGVPSIVLMEKAAMRACDVIFNDIKGRQDTSVVLICGYGNNGGDGLALARMLYQRGIPVSVLMTGDPNKTSELNRKEQDILIRYGILTVRKNVEDCIPFFSLCEGAGHFVIVDALFGTGLSRPLDGTYKKLVEHINSLGAYIYSLDVPSGLYTDGGGYDNTCIKADKTITFGFNKLGLITAPGAVYAGEVVCVDIGIDLLSIYGDEPVFRRILNRSGVRWPSRNDLANKSTYGKLLVIAGSKDVFGAAYMAARAAFAMGIGMVKVITHENNRMPLQTALPEAMYSFYEDQTKEEELREMVKDASSWADGIIIGPGIGCGDMARLMLRCVIDDSGLPVLMDADAIRIIAGDDDMRMSLARDEGRKVIFTPHMGEFACLMHKEIPDVKEHVTSYARSCADELKISLICKDARTITASYDHTDIYVNSSGNEGMATAGSGDVLAGMCAVLMIQLEDPHLASAYGVYLHGLAGDDASLRSGNVGMTASDIIDSIQRIL